MTNISWFSDIGVPEGVIFNAMSLGPGFMPRGGAKGQNLGHC